MVTLNIVYLKQNLSAPSNTFLFLFLFIIKEAGVMIYVLLYKEMEMALTIQSIYSKTALLKLHPRNIKVYTA